MIIIIGILLNIAGLGAVCWALFALAIYALLFFVGMTTGMYAYRIGIGPVGAIIGSVASGFGLLAGQYTFSVARSPGIRLRCPPVCGPGGIGWLSGDSRPRSDQYFPGMVAESICFDWRSRGWMHRMGSRGDTGNPNSKRRRWRWVGSAAIGTSLGPVTTGG